MKSCCQIELEGQFWFKTKVLISDWYSYVYSYYWSHPQCDFVSSRVRCVLCNHLSATQNHSFAVGGYGRSSKSRIALRMLILMKYILFYPTTDFTDGWYTYIMQWNVQIYNLMFNLYFFSTNYILFINPNNTCRKRADMRNAGPLAWTFITWLPIITNNCLRKSSNYANHWYKLYKSNPYATTFLNMFRTNCNYHSIHLQLIVHSNFSNSLCMCV